MLGVRLDPDEERRLNKVARETGRTKSGLAREWIRDRLEREEIDQKVARAAELDAQEHTAPTKRAPNDATGAWLRWLDEEDGGYDWGPAGPPVEQ